MSDIQVIPPEEPILARQEMYFGTLGATPQKIASDIAANALALGCTSVTILSHDGWWLVASDLDWLSMPNRAGFNEANAFERLWPLPEAGENFYLSTIMARIFASATATRTPAGATLVKGTSDDLEHFSGISADLSDHGRIIGFRFKAAG